MQPAGWNVAVFTRWIRAGSGKNCRSRLRARSVGAADDSCPDGNRGADGHPGRLRARRASAGRRIREGDIAGALDHLERAAAILDALHVRRELARVFISLGRLHRVHGRREASVEFYQRALAMALASNDDLAAANSYHALAAALRNLRRHAAALTAYGRGLAISKRIRALTAGRYSIRGAEEIAGAEQRTAARAVSRTPLILGVVPRRPGPPRRRIRIRVELGRFLREAAAETVDTPLWPRTLPGGRAVK